MMVPVAVVYRTTAVVAVEVLVVVRLKPVLVRVVLRRTAVNLLLLLNVRRRLVVLVAAKVRCLEDSVQLAHVVDIGPCTSICHHLLFLDLPTINATLWPFEQALGDKGHEGAENEGGEDYYGKYARDYELIL